MLVPSASATAEDAFVRRHARHIFQFRLTRGDGGVELEGVVDSYYRKQLVLRDAVAVWGWPALRTRITVRRPASDRASGGKPFSTPVRGLPSADRLSGGDDG